HLVGIVVKPCILAEFRRIVTETVSGFCSCPAGPFPLGFRRKRVFPGVRQSTGSALPFCQFAAEIHGVVPSDIRCRKTVAYFVRRLPRPRHGFHHASPFRLRDRELGDPVTLAQSYFDGSDPCYFGNRPGLLMESSIVNVPGGHRTVFIFNSLSSRTE